MNLVEKKLLSNQKCHIKASFQRRTSKRLCYKILNVQLFTWTETHDRRTNHFVLFAEFNLVTSWFASELRLIGSSGIIGRIHFSSALLILHQIHIFDGCVAHHNSHSRSNVFEYPDQKGR